MARVDLGMSRTEWLSITPRILLRMLDRMQERRTADRRLAEVRAGVIAAVIANVNRDPKKTPTAYTVSDFFPDAEVRHEKTDAELFEQVKVLNALFGGSVTPALEAPAIRAA